VSSCKELLARFISQHFPVLKAQSAEGGWGGQLWQSRCGEVGGGFHLIAPPFHLHQPDFTFT
jgi:hypothetical protein